MDFVTLNKQKSAIKSPDKKSASPRGSLIFVAASLKFGKVRQNFVRVKHAGPTHLQHSLTVFFCKVNKNSVSCDRPISLEQMTEKQNLKNAVNFLN